MFPVGKLAKLVAKAAGAGVSLLIARRRAVRGFRAGLEEMDLPPDVVRELVRRYPSFVLTEAAGRSPAASARATRATRR